MTEPVGIFKTQNSIQSKKTVSIYEEARSYSHKRSDGTMKSSSSFQDKQNSIISEEDSAFGEQTPAANNSQVKNSDINFNQLAPQ